jgi:signal transduction histidine kinase
MSICRIDDHGQSPTGERQEGIGILMQKVHTPESHLALEFVQTIIRHLDGQITVDRSADGGTTITLTFPVSRAAAGMR